MTHPLPVPARVARLSYFFPAHNEEANLDGLVEEALATLPTLAETFEIIAVDDGSKDGTPAHRRRARRRPPRHRPRRPPPDQPRLRRGAPLRLRGRPLRARRLHRRRSPVQGRRHRPPDRPPGRARRSRRRRRLPDQARRPARPDPLRARLPPGQPHLLRPQGHRRRLRLQALPARGARGPRGRIRRRLLLGRDDHQAAGRRGATVVEVGVPHYPRTAGSATGAKPQVVLRAVRDFWLLRLRMWANRNRALRRGRPIIDD